MAKHHDHHHLNGGAGARPPSRPTGRTNLASCVVATVFLIFVVIVSLIVYFMLFKPKDPKISVTSVQLPSFSLSGGAANFTFSQYAAVHNPNRSPFTHYDSSLQLLYSGGQVGFLFIPAGEIDSGRTQFMAATFAVQSFPVVAAAAAAATTAQQEAEDRSMGYPGMGAVGFGPQSRVGSTMEIESRIDMAGRVKVLHFFTHHVVAKALCKVDIAIADGSVLGFHC